MKNNRIEKKKKILILGATINQLPFVKIAKDKDCFSITLDNIPESICHKYSDQNANISTIDKNLVLKYAKEQNVDGIVTCASDLALPTVTYVCNKLKLPSVKTSSVLKTINKNSFRKFLLENKFSIPKYFIFSEENKVLEKLLKLKNKWIIKPIDNSGSKGIYLIDLNSKQNLTKIIGNAFSFSRAKKIIIEEYIDGEHCSVDGFFNKGKVDVLCITNKLLTPLPYRTPVGHTVPSKLEEKTQKNIKNSIERVLKLLEADTSPFDFDIVVAKDGEIFILEMSLRIGGNGMPKILMYSQGYDLYNSVFLYALGEKIPKAIKNSNSMNIGVFLICSDKKGKLKSITPKEKIINKYKKSIKEIVYDISIGEKVEKFIQGNHRIGHYILQAKTNEQLMNLAELVKSDLKLTVI